MKLHIGPGRLSFPKLFKPNEKEFGGKYACTLLLPPEYDLTPLKEALKQAAIEKFGPDQDKWPKGMKGPKTVIRPCEEKSHLSGYLPGWHFVSASSADMPGVVDGALREITDEKEAYAGRWAIMSVNSYGYDNVSKGVTFGLQNVQLRQDDDGFSSRVAARNEFEEFYEDMRSEAGDDFRTAVPGATNGGAGASGWDD
jgi:hypothetical protein